MKKLLHFAFIYFLSTLFVFAQEKKLMELLKENEISGMQLMYSKNGKTQAYNVGMTKEVEGKKVEANTIFQAASLSKTVFAYIVLRLYDRGLLDIDEPILNYVSKDFDRYDRSNPNYSKITARMVLRHTTGFPNWGDEKTALFQFPPDSCWGYSGEGYAFLQKGVENKLGKSLEQLAVEEVFTPLGMKNSGFVWNEKFEGLAPFINKAEDKANYTRANAAYSMLTNATDFNIFLGALLKGSGLKPETHKMMFAKASPANRFNSPVVESDKYIDWGLGAGLQTNEKGNAIWHWGDNGQSKCFYIAYPEKNEILVYFIYNFNGLDITEEITKVFLGKQTCWAAKWLAYGFGNPKAMKALKAELAKQGFDKLQAVIDKLKSKDAKFQLLEIDLNNWGYSLLRQSKKTEASEIFKLNTTLYPNSWNVYDSYGEVLLELGKKEEAIKMYQKSVELNPKNENGKNVLKELQK